MLKVTRNSFKCHACIHHLCHDYNYIIFTQELLIHSGLTWAEWSLKKVVPELLHPVASGQMLPPSPVSHPWSACRPAVLPLEHEGNRACGGQQRHDLGAQATAYSCRVWGSPWQQKVWSPGLDVWRGPSPGARVPTWLWTCYSE